MTPGSAIATTGQRPPAAGCPGARHRSHLPPLPGIRSDQRLNDRSERIQFIVSAAARNPYPFLIPADPLSIRIHYPVRSGKAVTVTRKRPRAACCAVAGQPPSRCAQIHQLLEIRIFPPNLDSEAAGRWGQNERKTAQRLLINLNIVFWTLLTVCAQ